MPVLNKTSPRAHTELELDVLGISKMLVKYIVHLSKKNFENIYFSSHKLPKQQSTQSTNYWFQGILEINKLNVSCNAKRQIVH
jgi:hypothetical protein